MTRPTDDELRELLALYNAPLGEKEWAHPRVMNLMDMAPTLAREVLERRAELARLREGLREWKDLPAPSEATRRKSPEFVQDYLKTAEAALAYIDARLRALITEGEGK